MISSLRDGFCIRTTCGECLVFEVKVKFGVNGLIVVLLVFDERTKIFTSSLHLREGGGVW